MMSHLGELNSDDALSGRALPVDPALLGGVTQWMQGRRLRRVSPTPRASW
jgi:hypothetical protein